MNLQLVYWYYLSLSENENMFKKQMQNEKKKKKKKKEVSPGGNRTQDQWRIRSLLYGINLLILWVNMNWTAADPYFPTKSLRFIKLTMLST